VRLSLRLEELECHYRRQSKGTRESSDDLVLSFLGEEEEEEPDNESDRDLKREKTLAWVGFRVKRLDLREFGPSDSFRVLQGIKGSRRWPKIEVYIAY
jgi:hypothetical protein